MTEYIRVLPDRINELSAQGWKVVTFVPETNMHYAGFLLRRDTLPKWPFILGFISICLIIIGIAHMIVSHGHTP